MSTAKIITNQASPLLKFTARLMCPQKIHSHRRAYACSKHSPALFLCASCQHKSRAVQYLYICVQCQTCFCAMHYIAHAHLFHICTSHALGINCTSSEVNINENCLYLFPLIQFYSMAINLVYPNICVKLSKEVSCKAAIISCFINAKNIHKLSNSLHSY